VGAAASWSEEFRTAAPAAGPAIYERIMVPPLFVPWAERLLDLLEVEPGLAVLDVACGPGTVARLAAARVGPYGAVTGCDVSAAMLATARAKPPVEGGGAIEYVECPGDALAVADDAFDVVTCQHGLQFFPDRPRALAEMRRAARPGARLGLAVWTAIDESPVFAALARVVDRLLGPEAGATYRGGPWGLSDGGELEELVRDAGFTDVQLRREVLPVWFDGGPAQVVSTLAVTALASRLASLDPGERERLAAAADEELGQFAADGRLGSETVANIALATA